MFLLVPNEENSHLFLIVSVPFQQTVENVSFQNMNEDEAPLPEFKAVNGNEFLEQIDQKLKLRRVKKLTTKAMRTERKVRCFNN